VPGRIKKFVLALAVFGLFVVVFSLSFSRAIRAGSNHDEHQFIASAELLADQGLLPYRDYPYFHLPNLVFVYGLLYSFTEYKLLAARLISAVCITAAACLLYLFSLDSFKNLSSPAGHWVGAGSVLLFVASPLIAFTGSFAWNHNLAMLLALLAFLLHWQGPNVKDLACGYSSADSVWVWQLEPGFLSPPPWSHLQRFCTFTPGTVLQLGSSSDWASLEQVC
jgi:hypothetical protein